MPTPKNTKARNAQRKRTRGAQPQNDNAADHGIYSRHFTDDEIERIIKPFRSPDTNALDVAIEASFVLLDRTIARLSARGLDTEAFTRLASVHNETTGRIAHLVRTQRLVNANAADSLAGHIGAVLDELNEALHAHQPQS